MISPDAPFGQLPASGVQPDAIYLAAIGAARSALSNGALSALLRAERLGATPSECSAAMAECRSFPDGAAYLEVIGAVFRVKDAARVRMAG